MISLLVMLVGAAVGIVGFVGWLARGICDTSCPSDAAFAAYKAMTWGGAAAFVIGGILLVASLRRRSRR